MAEFPKNPELAAEAGNFKAAIREVIDAQAVINGLNEPFTTLEIDLSTTLERTGGYTEGKRSIVIARRSRGGPSVESLGLIEDNKYSYIAFNGLQATIRDATRPERETRPIGVGLQIAVVKKYLLKSYSLGRISYLDEEEGGFNGISYQNMTVTDVAEARTYTAAARNPLTGAALLAGVLTIPEVVSESYFTQREDHISSIKEAVAHIYEKEAHRSEVQSTIHRRVKAGIVAARRHR